MFIPGISHRLHWRYIVDNIFYHSFFISRDFFCASSGFHAARGSFPQNRDTPGSRKYQRGPGFIDSARIFVKAGDGGKGCESFHRDKYSRYPVPDGGDGGDGGNIVIRANRNLHTLLDFKYRKHFKAKKGKIGSGNGKKGARGQDCTVEVPCGTQVFDVNLNFLLRDLERHGEQVIVARGGGGGRGNRGGSQLQEGQKGEAKTLALELKLIADVGIVGFPNAGKSSLVSKISTAKTKIASYPFTTKSPHLGLVELDDKSFTIADLPGLIENAHKGKGLGDRFLRHVERTRILIHLLDISPFSQNTPFDAYRVLNNELLSYSSELLKKTQVIVVNKIDLAGSDEKIEVLKKKINKKIFLISCKDERGIKDLVEELVRVLWKDKD